MKENAKMRKNIWFNNFLKRKKTRQGQNSVGTPINSAEQDQGKHPPQPPKAAAPAIEVIRVESTSPLRGDISKLAPPMVKAPPPALPAAAEARKRANCMALTTRFHQVHEQPTPAPPKDTDPGKTSRASAAYNGIDYWPKLDYNNNPDEDDQSFSEEAAAGDEEEDEETDEAYRADDEETYQSWYPGCLEDIQQAQSQEEEL